MGNTDSQHSNFMAPGKSCSLRFPSKRAEVPSPHSWWRGSEGSRPGGRCFLPQQRSSQPYSSWHYQQLPKVGSGEPSVQLREESVPNCVRSQVSFKSVNKHYGYMKSNAEGSGIGACGRLNPDRPLESRRSPKVLLSKDGSMRVEFTSGRVVPAESQGPAARHPTSGGPEPSLRNSKGSSLSSEGSWYDAPWGNATELVDNVFTCRQNADNCSGYTTFSSTRTDETSGGYASSGYNTFSSAQMEDISPGFATGLLFPTVDTNSGGEFINGGVAGYTTCYSGRTEDSGIRDSVIVRPELRESGLGSLPSLSLSDLYSSTAAAFPPSAQIQDASAQPRRSSPSFPLVSEPLDVVIQEEISVEEQTYSSVTLPCHRAESGVVAASNSRKDFLKSRIRRLSDWTGSLSKKKRRMQEPYGSESGDVFRNGLDPGLSNSSTLWSCNPLHVQNLTQNLLQVPSVRCGSSGSATSHQTPYGDALQQNIYENFMQELEMGHSRAEVAEPSEGEGEEGGEESSSGSLGCSLEQLDLLFEKEQGVVRRAGWLSFKALITVNKDRKLEMVSRRKWRHYWVTLKGCTLLFYETLGKSTMEQEGSPGYALLAEDSIVQAVPEHPKKENVFCLSNSCGDVYLFQAANQTDLENWVRSIHSASASLLAKRQGKEDTLRFLRSHTRSLLQKIDMDGKMKKMAELQLSVIRDQKNRKAVESQIQQWEQNLEKLNVDLFRLRCYQASLQGSELPNPKSLLAVAGRPSKAALGRLGVFSVSSFHALTCTRDDSTLRRRCSTLSGGNRHKQGLFSSLKALDTLTKRSRDNRHSASQVFDGLTIGLPAHPASACSSERLDAAAKMKLAAPSKGGPWYCGQESQLCVSLPEGQAVYVPVREDSLVLDLLSAVCTERKWDQNAFCLRVKRCAGQKLETSTAALTDPLGDLVYDELEVAPLHVFTIQLSRLDTSRDFGFAVTGHVDGIGRSHVFVSEVNPLGVASSEGLRAGDEILDLNGSRVSGLDLGLMHTLFSHTALQLVLRREESGPEEPGPSRAQNWNIDVPPPTESPDTPLAPGVDDVSVRSPPAEFIQPPEQKVDKMCMLYQTFPESCGVEVESPRNPYLREAGPQPPCPRHMSVSQRLCKVIQELVDTEKSYVKDLGYLFDIFLTPLQQESFLSKEEMESLFGSLPEMLDFQRVFLHTLEERIASCPNLSSLDTPNQFKKLLFLLGGSFLYYADHFKLYSGFCANHIKVQKVLERAKTDQAFKEFLEARNPTKQHSSTLESYLIKPVQRVLKYPLLLRELVSLTDAQSPEHSHLTEALRAMEKVASHINDMQKIYEDFGPVFDQLVAEQNSPDKEVTEISMGEFLIHSSVVWLNPLPSLGRMRRDPELTLFVFKRAIILVYRENIKLKKRMTSSRSSDLDSFRFRWLVPASAVQVRQGNVTGTENPCVWELVHTRSELEGRPETVFQLCSRGMESKATVVRALRSILRDVSRQPSSMDRTSRESTSSLRRTRPATDRGNSWRRRQQQQQQSRPEARTNTLPRRAEPGSTSPGGCILLGDACCLEPRFPERATSLPGHEADALGKRARVCSLTSDLEAQLQKLNFTEEPALREQAGYGPGYSLGCVPSPWVRRDGMDLQGGSESADLNSLLERDFSVQSMTSVVNEDCFYDSVLGIQKAAIPSL